jgi:hypothetical protein
VEFTATGIVGAPVRLGFLQVTTQISRNITITPAIRVGVLDASSNVVANRPTEITLLLNGSPANSLAGTTRRQTNDGVATFDDLRVINGGLFSFRANATGLQSASSASFSVF